MPGETPSLKDFVGGDGPLKFDMKVPGDMSEWKLDRSGAASNPKEAYDSAAARKLAVDKKVAPDYDFADSAIDSGALDADKLKEKYDTDAAFLAAKLGVTEKEAKKMIDDGLYDVAKLREMDDTVPAEKGPEPEEGYEDNAGHQAYDMETALRHAETLRAAQRSESKLDYATTDKLIEGKAIDEEKVQRENREPLADVLYKVGFSDEEAAKIMADIESGEGFLKEEDIRKMPEKRLAHHEREYTPEETLVADLIWTTSLRESGDWSSERTRIAGIALEKVTGSQMGAELDTYIENQKTGTQSRRRAESLKVDWIDAENTRLDHISDLKELVARIERGLGEDEDRSEIEAQIESYQQILVCDERQVVAAQENVARQIGYTGEILQDQNELGQNIEDTNFETDNLEQWKQDLDNGEITPEVLAFFERAGITEQIQRAFDRAYQKSFLTAMGEAVQTWGIVGGEGNDDEMPQLMQNPEAFRAFLQGPAGTEVLQLISREMGKYQDSVSRLHRSLVRPLSEVSTPEVLSLLNYRSQTRERMVSQTHVVANETRRAAAGVAWGEAGKEFWRQIKTQVARVVSSDVDGRGSDETARVLFETSLGEIIDESSNVYGERIQELRADLTAIVSLVPGSERVIGVVDHFITERLRTTILRRRQVNAHHIEQGETHGNAIDRHETIIDRWNQRQDILENIRMKRRARRDLRASRRATR